MLCPRGGVSAVFTGPILAPERHLRGGAVRGGGKVEVE